MSDIIYVKTEKICRRVESCPFYLTDNNIIEGGNWDEDIRDVTDSHVYRSLFDMFVENKKWQETELFWFIMTGVNSGKNEWYCQTAEDVHARGEQIYQLYAEIKKHGVIPQNKLSENLKDPRVEEDKMRSDDIYVSISRHGELLFANNGTHRFGIAKILGIEYIPVKIYKRHEEWENYKLKVTEFCNKIWKGKTYQRLPHPDFNNLTPIFHDNRYDLIKKNTKYPKSKLLDIGSLFGYICYKAELDGFECTAVESHNEYLDIMRKLHSACNMKYRIFDSSVFDIHDKKYDIVVAYNIFHHFIKTEKDYNNLVKLLNELDYKEMFVQFHKTNEAQMANAFKNFNEEEFANFIIKNSKNKTSFEMLGELDGRKIAKIY